MGAELVLGIDVGSTTSKAALVSLDGRVVALEEVTHTISRPRPGWAEHDADAVWWTDVVTLCRRLLPPRGGGHVVAAAAAALGPCLVLADAAGRPLRPAILYGIDTRAVAEIAAARRALGRGRRPRALRLAAYHAGRGAQARLGRPPRTRRAAGHPPAVRGELVPRPSG